MIDRVKKCAEKIVGIDNVEELDKPNMGVESFSYFSLERPAAFYFLGIRNEERGIIHPAHNSLFDIDEKALPIGVAIQCKAVYEYLNTTT
jgi:metal-dependent amidase/aminoacylase/carboxypeptidase family protein